MNTNLGQWTIHLIAFCTDWSWNLFTLHNFSSNAHQAAGPWKSENWELFGKIFEIKLWKVGQSTSWCLFTKAQQIAERIFKLKIKACPVTAGHYMVFKHQISFATNSEANFDCNLFRIMLDIVLCCANQIWADSLSSGRCPFLRQVVNIDLLLCTGLNLEHEELFLCHGFTYIPMTDWKVEQSNGRQHLLAYSIENFISHLEKLEKLFYSLRAIGRKRLGHSFS